MRLSGVCFLIDLCERCERLNVDCILGAFPAANLAVSGLVAFDSPDLGRRGLPPGEELNQCL